MRKKLLTIALSVCMVLTAIPMTAVPVSAAEDQTKPTCNHTTGWIPVNNIEDFETLVDGGKYYLTTDVAETVENSSPGHLVIKDMEITICLSNYTLSLGGSRLSSAIIVGSGGKLNLWSCGSGSIVGGAGTEIDTTSIAGGGIYVNGGTLNLYETVNIKGEIAGSYTNRYGGGIAVNNDGIVNMYGGTVSDNTGWTKGGGVAVLNGTFNLYNGATVEYNAAEQGGGVYLQDNTCTFNLCGGQIKGNKATDAGGGMYINGGTVNMSNGNSEMQDNDAGTNGGGVFMYAGTFNMSDGIISANATASGNGGGVCLWEGGKFNLSANGKINANTAVGGNGGGVYCSEGSLTMSGGEICENTAKSSGGSFGFGGGVYVDGGTGGTAQVRVHISGGKISANQAYKEGGGIYNAKNYTKLQRGFYGVCLEGNPIIEGNYIGTSTIEKQPGSSLYLADGVTIGVNDMADGAAVEVTLKSVTPGEENVFSTGGSSGAIYFCPFGHTYYAVGVNDEGNLYLSNGDRTTVTMNPNNNSGEEKITYELAKGSRFYLPACPFTPDNDKQFVGWSTSYPGTVLEDDHIELEDSYVFLYAIWGPADITGTVSIVDEDNNPGPFKYGDKLTASVAGSNIIDSDNLNYAWYGSINDVYGDNNDWLLGTGNTYTVDDNDAECYVFCVVTAKDGSRPGYICKSVKIDRTDVTTDQFTVTPYSGVYDGEEHGITVAITDSALSSAQGYVQYRLEGGSWQASSPTFKDVGNYTVEYSVNANKHNPYYGESTVTIAQKDLTVSIEDQSITYGDALGVDDVTFDGFVEGEDASDLTGTLAFSGYKQYDDVGTYTVTPSGYTSDNYGISYEAGEITVKQKPITLQWGDTAFTYNKQPQAPSVTTEDFVADDVVKLEISGAQTNASDTAYTATATLSGKDADNYKLPAEVTTSFTISKADANIGAVTLSTDNDTITDQTKPEDVILSRENTDVEGELKLTDSKMVANQITYQWKFVPKDESNYNGETGTLSIDVLDTQAPTVKIKAGGTIWETVIEWITFGSFYDETQTVSITYSDNENGSGLKDTLYYVADKELSIGELGSVEWLTYTDSFTLDTDGDYLVYAKVSDNDGNVTIRSTDGMVIDTTAPAISGITNGETYYGDVTFEVVESNLKSLKVDGTDVTEMFNQNGRYTIIADDHEHSVVVTDRAGNKTSYIVEVYIPRITENQLQVTTFSGIYDGKDHGVTVEILDSSQMTSNPVVTFSETGDYGTWMDHLSYKNAGTYPVYYCVSADKYHSYYGSTQVVIEEAHLQITATNQSITYGETLNQNAVTFDGFVEGEDISVLSGELLLGGYQQYDDAGTYTIWATGYVSPNYTIEYVEGSVTVAPKEISLQWGDETAFTYNKQPQAPSVTTEDFVAGDDVKLEISGAQTNASDTAYTATAVLVGDDAENYKLPTNTVISFTIDKANANIGAVTLSNDNDTITDQTKPEDVILSRTNTDVEGELKLTDSKMVANQITYQWKFVPKDESNYNGETGTISIDVLDTQAPTVEIEVGGTIWKEVINFVSFGQFFDEEQVVTITYSDNENGSGLKDTLYYVAEEPLAIEARSSVEWLPYTGSFILDAEGDYIIYAKGSDNDGNAVIISSDGMVIDKTAPIISGITNDGSYVGDTTFKVSDGSFISVQVDGTDVSAQLNEDGEYTIVADDRTHEIIVTDAAGNQTVYQVFVERAADDEPSEPGTEPEQPDGDEPNEPSEPGTEPEQPDGNSGEDNSGNAGSFGTQADGDDSDESSDAKAKGDSVDGEEETTSPRTGDSNHLGQWILLMIAILGGISGLHISRKKKNEM